MKLNEKALNKISTLTDEFNNIFIRKHFKNLTEKEFNDLMKLVIDWYYWNNSIDKYLSKPQYISLFKKIDTGVYPKQIYRGLTFGTKKEQDMFIQDLKKGIGSSRKTSSWTGCKRILKKFLPKGEFTSGKKYGVELTLSNKYIKNNLIFSLESLLKDRADQKRFFEIILKRFNLTAKKASNNLKLNTGLFSEIHGSVYTLTEKEYIMKDPLIDYNQIQIRIVNS